MNDLTNRPQAIPPPTSERPTLTAWCEAALLRLLRSDAQMDARPLPKLPSRLLVVKVHGMGDSIMVRSLIEHLHLMHPEIQIGIMAGSATRDVLTLGSDFELHEYNQQNLGIAAILKTWTGIRKAHYDAIINFEQGSVTGTAFLRATGIPVRIGFLPLAASVKGALLTHPLRFRESDSMWVSFVRLLQLVDPEFPESVSALPLPIGDDFKASVRDWIHTSLVGAVAARTNRRLVALHMGSGQKRPFRRWPVQQFIALGERLNALVPGLAIILTGQGFEHPLIREFIEGFSGVAIDATGIGSIERTATLLAECDLLVANDTGIMHLGAAMGTPTVGIFGPETPRRWAPVGPRAISVCATGVSCSPCANTYRLQDARDCVNPDRIRCLREVSIEMVLDAARQVTIGGWINGASEARRFG